MARIDQQLSPAEGQAGFDTMREAFERWEKTSHERAEAARAAARSETHWIRLVLPAIGGAALLAAGLYLWKRSSNSK